MSAQKAQGLLCVCRESNSSSSLYHCPGSSSSSVKARSLIPVPKTYNHNSQQCLPKTQSSDNLYTNRANGMTCDNKANTPLTRKITRTVSVSRLPTITTGKVNCPLPMDRSTKRGSNSVNDLTTVTSGTNSMKTTKIVPKIFKPNDSHISCQRFQKNHTNYHNNSKPLTSFKIYNKFSPYYENESLDYQCNGSGNTDRHYSIDSECQISDISSLESSTCLTRITDNGNKNNTADDSQILRCQSVPEHIERLQKKASDYNKEDNWIQAIDRQFIERLKDRIIESIENEEDVDEDKVKEDNCFNNSLPQNVENKLLRVVIKHLKEKLCESKATIGKMSLQLTTNQQMCEALQKSLSALSIRAQQMTLQLETKDQDIDKMRKQCADKASAYEDIQRRHQLIDSELKRMQKLNSMLIMNNNNHANNAVNGAHNSDRRRTGSSLSATPATGDTKSASIIDGSIRLKRMTSSWLMGNTLSKAFKRKNKSKSSTDLLSTTNTSTECVTQLRDIIRYKDTTINDMRLQSIQANTRLDRLEGELKLCRDETNQLKRSKELLEKMIQLKNYE